MVIAFSATFVSFGPVPAARAEHGDPLLLVKPGSGSEIPRNARIRLVSYNGEDGLIQLLGRSPGEVRISLESDAGSVRLRPVRYLTDHDGYGRAMVSLAPGRLLAPRTAYRLVVDVRAWGWREELAAFVTTAEVDRTAPRWSAKPDFDPVERRFVGRLVDPGDFVEVGFTVRPRAGGIARRTFVLFDLAQQCIDGPTADYNVAIYNSQCVDAEELEQDQAACDTLYYFPAWRRAGAIYDVAIELRDLAGNVRRLRVPAARIDLDAPFGLCLEI